jgi:hypothetical protein
MLMLLGLFACGERAPAEVTDTDDTNDTTPDDPSLTFYADIKPIMAAHCTRCHNPNGIGIGDFTDPELVQTFAPAIAAAIEDGRMPPPASDPGCQDYNGSDLLTLSDDEKSDVLSWIELGSPLGDPEDEPEIPVVSHDLIDPDLTLMMSAPYTPVYADTNNPANEYRCFLLEKPEGQESFYITSLAPVIDQTAIVHHSVLFTSSTAEIQPFLEDFNDGDGIDCINNLNSASGMLAAWAPGMMPIEFPEGMGLRVQEDDQIILQVHYYYSGPETENLADNSGYAFKTAETVEREVLMAPLGSFNFRIPANDDDYTHTDTFNNAYIDLEVFGMFPHMHILGQRFDARIKHEDGSETCLVKGDYDFDNQMTYQFTDPVTFASGDTIEFSCNWNNSTSNPGLSTEPKETTYGERTDEEMCYFFSFVALK